MRGIRIYEIFTVNSHENANCVVRYNNFYLATTITIVSIEAT